MGYEIEGVHSWKSVCASPLPRRSQPSVFSGNYPFLVCNFCSDSTVILNLQLTYFLFHLLASLPLGILVDVLCRNHVHIVFWRGRCRDAGLRFGMAQAFVKLTNAVHGIPFRDRVLLH